jgi:nucleoside-diphosphate-sugar epimerase
MMRILVIGGNGFIGTPLVRELVNARHAVAVLHRRIDVSSSGVTHLEGDRNSLPEYLSALREFAPDVVIDMILSSAEQARQLMTVAESLNARVLAVSSMDVYRAWGIMLGTEPGEPEPLPLTEDSRLRTARQTYPPALVEKMKSIFTWLTPGYEKLDVEEEVMAAGSRNTVIRLPMVFGPGDPLHRLYGIVKRVKDRRPVILLPEDHAAWRGPRGYVENVAHAIALAAISPLAAGRSYHVCDEPTLTELEWQKKIAAEAKWTGRFVLLPSERVPKHLVTPGNAVQHVAASSERIRTELGYTEVVTAEEAIRRTIAWEEAHQPTGTTLHPFDYPAEDAAVNS